MNTFVSLICYEKNVLHSKAGKGMVQRDSNRSLFKGIIVIARIVSENKLFANFIDLYHFPLRENLGFSTICLFKWKITDILWLDCFC